MARDSRGTKRPAERSPISTAAECQQHTGFQPLRKDITKPILQMRETEVYLTRSHLTRREKSRK